MSQKNLRIITIFSFVLFIILFFLFFVSRNQTKQDLSSATPSSNRYREILLTDSGFQPTEATISAGDTVVFRTTLSSPFWPASDLHPTHGIYPEFDPQTPIEPSKSWEFRFLKSGRWKYHDHLTPHFRGIIFVN